MRQPISSIHPVFYFVVVKLRRFARHIRWCFGKDTFAKTTQNTLLPHSVHKHKLVVVRQGDPLSQANKVANLQRATAKLNGIVIGPRETFSLCYLLGCATKRKGYLAANTLSNGEVIPKIGGGLCKLPTLIHWVCLHSPLTVTECHQHSFDPFPDEPGVVPSGSGPTFFYNYLDYQLKNNTPYTFQLMLGQEGDYIVGELRADSKLPYRYHVYEANDHFVETEGKRYRKIETWRQKVDANDVLMETALIGKTKSLVKYAKEQ